MPLVKVDPDAVVTLVVPTAINLTLLASENVSANLRLAQASSLELPSLYRRAFMSVYETDEIAVVQQKAK